MQCEDLFSLSFPKCLLCCTRVCVCVKMSFSPNVSFYFHIGSIPDEAKALSLLAPANAVAGILPGGGLLPTPNPMNQSVSLQIHWKKYSPYKNHFSSGLWCILPESHAPGDFKSYFLFRWQRRFAVDMQKQGCCTASNYELYINWR